jgi:hypothetical protein
MVNITDKGTRRKIQGTRTKGQDDYENKNFDLTGSGN